MTSDNAAREALEAACLEGLVSTPHGYRYRPSTGADAVEHVIADLLESVAADPSLRLSGHSGISVTKVRDLARRIRSADEMGDHA
jgi:hypothetical protein